MKINSDNEHVCNPTINPCTCGLRWEFRLLNNGNKTTYTSRKVRDLYEALYGNSNREFAAVEG